MKFPHVKDFSVAGDDTRYFLTYKTRRDPISIYRWLEPYREWLGTLHPTPEGWECRWMVPVPSPILEAATKCLDSLFIKWDTPMAEFKDGICRLTPEWINDRAKEIAAAGSRPGDLLRLTRVVLYWVCTHKAEDPDLCLFLALAQLPIPVGDNP